MSVRSPSENLPEDHKQQARQDHRHRQRQNPGQRKVANRRDADALWLWAAAKPLQSMCGRAFPGAKPNRVRVDCELIIRESTKPLAHRSVATLARMNETHVRDRAGALGPAKAQPRSRGRARHSDILRRRSSKVSCDRRPDDVPDRVSLEARRTRVKPVGASIARRRDRASALQCSELDGLTDNWTSSPTPRLSPDQLAEFTKIAEAWPERESTASCAGGGPTSSAPSRQIWRRASRQPDPH